MDKILEIRVFDEEDVGERLDTFLASELDGLSRSKISKAIKDGQILLNNLVCKPSKRLELNDLIYVDREAFSIKPILPEPINLDVIYEDDDIVVVNKPANMLVHPTEKIRSNTLVNAMLSYSKNWSTINGEERPGIVHRLDAQTSGLLTLCKNDKTHIALAGAFKDREVKKEYLALVEGSWDCNDLEVNVPIGRMDSDPQKRIVREDGKNALSYFTTLDKNEKASLVKAEIVTGRTHQIRVHAKYMGHPVIGDTLYGYKKQRLATEHQLLHSYKIGFLHPWKKKYMEFKAGPDHEFIRACDKLGLKFDL